MKPKILRTDAELHMVESALGRLGEVARVVTASGGGPGELALEARDADIILTCYTEIPASVIEAASRLRGIVKYGVGIDSIDIEAATRRGVMVVNCPDYGSDTVADHAFALLLGLARRIPMIDRVMRQGAWVWPAPEYLGVDLAGKTLGLVGWGRIGRAMGRRGAGFSMELLVCDPYLGDDARDRPGLRFTTLEELLAGSDFVSLHCVLTPETRRLIGERELRTMKETAFLIDVSRGAIIDETALVRALEEGWIAGAGLDVFPDEPLGPGNPLLALPNTILTPHLAWYTEEAFGRVERETVERILEILDGRTPRHLRNPEVLDRAPGSPAADAARTNLEKMDLKGP